MNTPSSVGAVGERALIEMLRRRMPPDPSWVAVGIGDDAAVVAPERNTRDVLTTDALVEGVHFDRVFTPADAIGHRALSVNLSDLAAMGASPRVALFSLVLPPDLPLDQFVALAGGFADVAARYKVALVGGNITRSPGPLVVDVTAVGSVHPRKILRRGGARPGDELWVSGQIGAAAAGLASLRTGGEADAELALCQTAFLRPEPRVRLGLLLGRNGAATACVDLSDGLADGVHQIAAASGVGAIIDAGAIPVAPRARQWFLSHGLDPVHAAITGGDDYELLFAVSPRRRGRMAAVRQGAGGLRLTRIGVVTKSPAVCLSGLTGRDPLPQGYEHFR